MKGAAATTILWAINNSNHLAQNDLVSRTLGKCNCNEKANISLVKVHFKEGWGGEG